MGENANRTSKDHGPTNLALLRRLAWNLLRMARIEAKASMAKVRKRVGYNVSYLEKVLNAVYLMRWPWSVRLEA